jgi:predicted O-methyltransferase YrrM
VVESRPVAEGVGNERAENGVGEGSDVGTDGGFDDAFALADRIPGWLTRDQARVLWDAASALTEGSHVVEIGSHQGRSTVVLARALGRNGGRLTAIDAFVDSPRYGGASTRAVLLANLEQAGVSSIVDVVVARSRQARSRWSEPIDLLWVDGKHDYWTCTDDLRWTRHLPDGGRCLVHDAFSSIGVTSSLMLNVLPSRRLRLIGRVGSLATIEVSRPHLADRFRFLAQLPWWVRNVVIKVLLRLGLGSVTRRLGHVGPFDPY